MDSSVAVNVPQRARPIGWIVAVFVLLLLVLGCVVRLVSPHLTLGTSVAQAQCQGPGGDGNYCFRQVKRGEWLVLAPVDDFQVYVKGHPHYYSVGNPWVDDTKQSGTVEADGGFTLTDGKIAVRFTSALFDDLRD